MKDDCSPRLASTRSVHTPLPHFSSFPEPRSHRQGLGQERTLPLGGALSWVGGGGRVLGVFCRLSGDSQSAGPSGPVFWGLHVHDQTGWMLPLQAAQTLQKQSPFEMVPQLPGLAPHGCGCPWP